METLSISADTLSALRFQLYGALGIAEVIRDRATHPTPPVITDALCGLCDYLTGIVDGYNNAVDTAEDGTKGAAK